MLVAFDKTRPSQQTEFIDEILNNDELKLISIIVLLESHVDLNNNSTVLWKLFNNVDPKRDLHFIGDRLGIDLTRKTPEEGYRQRWPEEIVMTKEITDLVDEKWKRMFPHDNA